jgi:hypothetical protein
MGVTGMENGPRVSGVWCRSHRASTIQTNPKMSKHEKRRKGPTGCSISRAARWLRIGRVGTGTQPQFDDVVNHRSPTLC